MEEDKKSKEKEGNKKKAHRISIGALPRRTVEDVVPIIKLIYENFAGEAAPWDSIASMLNIGPKSPNTKYLIWSAEAYGVIQKTEQDTYRITEIGRKIIAPTFSGENIEAIKKAVLSPSIMSKFYTDYDKHPIPKDKFLDNILEQNYEIPRDRINEAKSILIKNAEYAHIIRSDNSSGNKFLFLEGKKELNYDEVEVIDDDEVSTVIESTSNTPVVSKDFENVCFVISPIGEELSQERKHADLVLNHLIVPVLEETGYKVVRADKIDKSGLITQQIFEYLISSAICIADLSFNNPNVFYELGVRHMCLLPTIQIIKKGDKIPFDVSQGRTIVIDMSDIYTIMDRFESARRELRDHVKSIVKNIGQEITEDNPVKIYLPGLKVYFPKK